MTIETIQEQLQEGSVLFVDIREADELMAMPSIEGAVHIPMGDMIAQMEQGTLPKDKKIVTVCRSDARSRFLDQMLSAHGYDADFLEGGMIGLQ